MDYLTGAQKYEVQDLERRNRHIEEDLKTTERVMTRIFNGLYHHVDEAFTKLKSNSRKEQKEGLKILKETHLVLKALKRD